MRILLIEDDPSTAESIELILRKADLNTYVTDSGEEGIELAKLYDYDLTTTSSSLI
jgi:two-component system cell cycle response regulator CtrA